MAQQKPAKTPKTKPDPQAAKRAAKAADRTEKRSMKDRQRDRKYRDRDAQRKHLEEMEKIRRGTAINRGVQNVSKSAATVLTATTGAKAAGEVASSAINDNDISQYNQLVYGNAPSDVTNGENSSGSTGNSGTGSSIFVP